jgi:hypothetical protein
MYVTQNIQGKSYTIVMKVSRKLGIFEAQWGMAMANLFDVEMQEFDIINI